MSLAHPQRGSLSRSRISATTRNSRFGSLGASAIQRKSRQNCPLISQIADHPLEICEGAPVPSFSTLLTQCSSFFYSWLWEEKMRTHTNDRLKGTLDLLVLKTLASQGRMHGYAVTLRIEEISESVLRLEEGSLYPAFHRMTQAGWLRSEWGVSESNRRARYYSITAAGRRQLAEETREWSQLTSAVARVLSLA
jgi:PadR family transcriptional regulator, regulatory protein PadR